MEIRQNQTLDALAQVRQKACQLAETVLASEPTVRMFLFGSRSRGAAGIRSDIDLGIDLGSPISPEVMTLLREAFDDLPVLQKVDIVDFSTVDEAFRAVALRHMAKIYERQAA